MKKQKEIKIGTATEQQVNEEFVRAWKSAEKGEVKTSEERLVFIDPATFFQVLSKRRIALLKALHANGLSSIRELSKLLRRDYKNVYQDVQLLKKAGLIQRDPEKRIFVPWDKISAEIALAA